jgi:hypothetical protein
MVTVSGFPSTTVAVGSSARATGATPDATAVRRNKFDHLMFMDKAPKENGDRET